MVDCTVEQYNDERLQSFPVVSNKRRRYKRRGGRCPSMLSALAAMQSDMEVEREQDDNSSEPSDVDFEGRSQLPSITQPAQNTTITSCLASRLSSVKRDLGGANAHTSTEAVFDDIASNHSHSDTYKTPNSNPSRYLSDALSALDIDNNAANHHNCNINNRSSTDCKTNNFMRNNRASRRHSIPDCLMQLPDDFDNNIFTIPLNDSTDTALNIVRHALTLSRGVRQNE